MKLNNKVDTIQVLRGIAALLVYFFHNRYYVEAIFPRTDHFFVNGISGVDIFFFISGFVLYISYNGDSTTEFAIKRFFRVYIPAAIAILITCWVTNTKIIGNMEAYKSLLMIPLSNSGAPYLGYNILAVIWTLTYELYFYLLFTLAVMLLRFSRIISLNVCIMVSLSVFLTQYLSTGTITLKPEDFIYNGNHSFIPAQLLSVAGNPILLNFVVGVIFGVLFKNFRALYSLGKNVTSWLIFIFTSVYVVCFVGPYYGHGFTGGATSSLFLFLAFLIWHRGIELGYYGQPNRKLVYLGTISYSIYLIHVIVYHMFVHLNPIKYIYDNLQLGGALFFGMILTFVFSVIYFHAVENTCQRVGRWIAGKL